MLMTKHYKESVKLTEKLCLFMNKYKQYMSRTSKSNVINRLADKSLNMLAVELLFYPMKVEDSLEYAIKERLGEKLEKLKKFDS
jgi:hypothetical protein